LSAAISGQGVTASDGTVVDPQIISSIPPQPQNVVANGGFANILVQWDDPNYRYFAAAEVWRSTSNDLGTAVLIGNAPGQMCADTPPASSVSVTYYYWVRFISTAAREGSFSAVASAHTATDPTYALEILAQQLSETELNSNLNSRINLIDAPTTGIVTAMEQLSLSVLDGIPDSYGHYLDLKWQQAVTDAVIEVDPGTGKIRLIGTAEITTDVENRVTVVEQSMDAVSGTIASHTATLATHGTDIQANATLIGQQQGQIDLMATSSYVDGRIADVSAALDPAAVITGQDLAAEATMWQLLTLGNIAHANMQFRSNADAISAEAAARILLAAKVDDNIAALVSESVTRASADSAEAEARLALMAIVNDPATGLAVTRASLLNDYYTKTAIDSASAGWISSAVSQAGSNTASTLLNYYTKTAADGAIASAKSEAIAASNGNTSTLLLSYTNTTGMNSAIATAKSEAVASANGNTALSLQSYTNTAGMNSAIATGKSEAIAAAADATAGLLTSYSTTAQMNSAITSAKSTLMATLNRTFKQTGAPSNPIGGYSLIVGDEWYDDNNRLHLWSGTAWVDSADAAFGNLTALISTESAVRAIATGPDWNPDDPFAIGKTCRSGNKLYQSIHSGNQNKPPATEPIYWKEITASLYAQYMIKTDVNGKVAGFGLANDGATSAFEILADKFIIAPTAAAPAAGKPFYVLTSEQTVNGVLLQAGTYFNTAFIGNATITNAMVGSLTADKLMVPGTASIWDAIITTGKITNAYIGDTIQSASWNGSTVGWKIDKTGSCVFNNATFRSTDGKTVISENAMTVTDGNGVVRVKVGLL
jgi:hypothetical protein